ncbi:MAG: hypothetical protein KAS78_00515 [Candidatus Pacebacteria bacterium]|nr:hypothetical protein [Candidatus Paceibacterota bacterium]
MDDNDKIKKIKDWIKEQTDKRPDRIAVFTKHGIVVPGICDDVRFSKLSYPGTVAAFSIVITGAAEGMAAEYNFGPIIESVTIRLFGGHKFVLYPYKIDKELYVILTEQD